MLLDEALEQAARVVTEIIAPRAESIDRDAVWPVDGIRALQAAGLGGLVLPRDVGGYGHGLFAVARMCEELGKVCPSTGISFGMHLVGSAVLAAKATDPQRARYLEPIARGEHLTTLALSEPGTGSHFYIPETRLARADKGYVASGTKSFVTNGSHADSYVVSVASADRGLGEFSCVLVDKDAPGLSWGEQWAGWGMRGNSARTATLDNVRLGPDALLGEEGDEIWYVFNVVAPYFLMAMSGTYLGLAQSALEEARTHLQRRTHSHSGASLSESTVVQHQLGTLWAQVFRTRTLVHEAARMGDAAHPDALLALCSAKAEVAAAAVQVAEQVMTLLGGRGYANESRIQRLYRDARAAHVMAPPTDMLRTWVGRAMLDLPLLGE